MIWTQSFDDRTVAIEAMEWFVGQRQNFNGAGIGAVLDQETDDIIATDGFPMPTGEDHTWAVDFVREKHGA